MNIASERFAPRFVIRVKCILELLGRNPRHFLEIGCGMGDFLVTLQNLGWEGMGIDISKEAIDIARKKVFSEKIALQQTALPEDHCCFNCIFVLEVLDHIKEDKEAILSWKKYMSDDSGLIVSVSARSKAWTKHDELAGHFRRYDKHELVHLFESSGLRVIKIINYGFPILNILNQVRGIIARRDARWKLPQNERNLKSGLNKGEKIGKIKSFLLRIIVAQFYPLQKLFWDYDLSDGYIIIASLQIDT